MDTRDAANFIFQAMKKEKHILSSIFSHYQNLFPEFKANKKIKMVRIQELHALVCACFYALSELFGAEAIELRERVKKSLLKGAEERSTRMASDHPDVENFWQVYQLINWHTSNDEDAILGNYSLDKEVLNHSTDDQLIALNLNEMAALAESKRHRLPLVKDLKKLLKGGKKYPYVTTGTVTSKITGKSKYVWQFKKPIEI
jgi:hypothetical protein